MLVLSRFINEKLILGDGEITVTVLYSRGNTVRLGIEADRRIGVFREEVFTALKADGVAVGPLCPRCGAGGGPS